MTALVAEDMVKDLDAFRVVFDEFQEARAAHGATGRRLLHAADDPTVVNVVIEFPSTEAARTFASDPHRAKTFERAGVFERADEVMEGIEALTY